MVAGSLARAMTEANAGAPLDLRLLESAAVEIDASSVRFGPARLVVAGANIAELQFEVKNGVISTSGRFDDCVRPTSSCGARST